LDSLFGTVAAKRGFRATAIDFVLALVYVCLHSVVLLGSLVTLNVAIHSSNNALLTLLVSNQFVELKGSVFKKIDKEMLFQTTCSDITERFQLALMLAITTLQNLSHSSWEVSMNWLFMWGSVLGTAVAARTLGYNV